MNKTDISKTKNSSTSARSSEGASLSVCKKMYDSEEEERTLLTSLRKLWKILLSRNERYLFVEKNLCRSSMVRFLASHLGGNTSDAVRCLALELLSGCVPRLGDKTEALIRPLVPPLLGLTGVPKEISAKAFHVLRAYSKATADIDSFVEDFCRLGLESNSEETQLSCIHGICIVFDQDIGDKLYSILLPSMFSLLNRNSPATILRSSYRSLRRIHDLIDDDRFLRWMDPEATHLYSTFLEFDEEDLYLNSELLDFPNLISEYQKKMARIHLTKAFGIVDPDYLMPIGDIRDSHRAMAVSKLATTLTNAPWNENEVESHILDLIKLVTAFLADDSNRSVKTSGLEILKEVISRLGFHLGQQLTNLVYILREMLVTSFCVEVKYKTKEVVHRLMKVVHPMSVVWEMFREWEPRHKEAVLGLICGEIRRFPYCDFDLVGLCATVGQEMEDSNPGIRGWSRECVKQLLNVIQASPVPVLKQQAVDVLLGIPSLKRETLRFLGILEAQSGGFDMSSYSEDCTAPSTAMSSTSTLVFQSSTVSTSPRLKYTSQLGPNTKPDTAQSTIGKYSRPNMALQERPTVTSFSSDLQSHSLNSFQVREDAAPSTAESTCDEIFNLKFGNKSSSPGKHAKNSLSSIKNSKGSTILKTPRNQHLPDIPHSNIPVFTGGYTSKIVISSRLYPDECTSAPVPMLNFTSVKTEEYAHIENVLEKKPQDISQHLKLKDLEHGEPISMCSIIYSDQILEKLNSPLSVPDSCSPISPPLETSTPQIRTNFLMDTNLVSSERRINFSGGDTKQVTTSHSSSVGQVQNLDPDKCNFNILSVSVPDLMQNIRELNDSFGNESLVEISPTLITTPFESDASPFPSTNRLPKSNNARKKQLADSKTKKTFTQGSKRESKDKVLSRPSSDKYAFNPAYYTLTYLSEDDSEDTGEDTVFDTSIGTDNGRLQISTDCIGTDDGRLASGTSQTSIGTDEGRQQEISTDCIGTDDGRPASGTSQTSIGTGDGRQQEISTDCIGTDDGRPASGTSQTSIGTGDGRQQEISTDCIGTDDGRPPSGTSQTSIGTGDGRQQEISDTKTTQKETVVERMPSKRGSSSVDKGVGEEVIPINIIKEKTADYYPPDTENYLI